MFRLSDSQTSVHPSGWRSFLFCTFAAGTSGNVLAGNVAPFALTIQASGSCSSVSGVRLWYSGRGTTDLTFRVWLSDGYNPRLTGSDARIIIGSFGFDRRRKVLAVGATAR